MTSMDLDDGAVNIKSEVPNKSLGPSYTQHLSQFHQVISQLQQAIQLMITNKANGIIDDHGSLPLRITSLITEMKTLNRILNHTMDHIRTNVQTEKSAFDRVSLDLQSLLYEKQHLQKQIRNQQHFKSKQKPIEMIPLEEFMALPSTQAQLAARTTPATPHDIHLLRLQHELAERKNLVGRVEELSLRKRSLFDLNDKRRTQLRTVQSKLAALYADAMPIQTLLNMSTMEMIPVPESVQELPLPLYHLYHSALCYQRAFDSDNQFSVTIDGDITRAHALKTDTDMTTPTTLPLDLPTLTSTYPLEIVMELKSNGVNVTLRLKWMIHLKVVTVTVDMKGGAATTAASSATPSLVNLYPDDAGTEWPNDLSTVLSAPAAVEFHRRFKLDPITLGTPYRWAQSLCGLHYPHPRHPSYPHPGLADVFKRIHMRVAIKQALHAQISTLVKKSYPFPDPSDDHPLKSRATLTKFTRTQKTEWDSMVLRTHGETYGNEHVEGADYYSVQLKRDEAILNGVIRITPEYPLRPPTFVLAYGHAAPALVPSKLVKQSSDPEALALAQSAGARATVVDNNIKEMEILANTHFSAPLTQLAQLEARGQAHVLAYQLRSLHMMFDLAGEPEISGTTTTKGLRDRFYERAIRGRDRRRPFLYDPTQHSFDQF